MVMNLLQQIKRNRELKAFRNTVESGDNVTVKINGVFHSGVIRAIDKKSASVYVNGHHYLNLKLSELYPPY